MYSSIKGNAVDQKSVDGSSIMNFLCQLIGNFSSGFYYRCEEWMGKIKADIFASAVHSEPYRGTSYPPLLN